MKNKIFKYISFFAALVMIVSACEKSDIDKANEAYDFSKVIPAVQGVTGPTAVVQTFSSETYGVNYFRGGSSWSWSVSGATLLSTSADTRSIEVDFPDDGEALITVTETTLGGVTSEPFVYSVTVNPPEVASVSGPTAVLQTFTEKYSIPYSRAGSTWDWTVTNAVLDSVSPDTKEAFVLFDTQGEATITVVETLYTGLASAPYDVTVTVAEYCPLTRDEFLGTWVGTETGDSDVDPLTVTFVAGTEDNEIVVEADADGYPAFLSEVFKGWGETFQPGFGPEGAITIVINLNGTLSIGFDYWGQTLPGPYDYWYFGSGNWSGCGTPSMDFDFNLDWNGSGTAQYTSTISLEKQ
ncbi:MAG: hypothetical protein KFF49_06160 [Bacteroidales bacterium]|nr:hypothetical protein [Bacteroidales bacterium]